MNLLLALALLSQSADDRPTILIVTGVGGSSEYAGQFHQWAARWQSAAAKGGAESILIGRSNDPNTTDRDQFREALTARITSGQAPLWLVLIGHGTFDGREAKFNLRGPDASADDLANWLAPATRPLVVLNCASSSGPFLAKLAAPNRVVVTATRSGDEMNFARFGQYLAETIADPAADLDKDGQTSLLEAYIAAHARTEEFYRNDARLATEHALLDDNGDALGTSADWFRGVRATKRAKEGASPDGLRAHQLHLIPSDRERHVPPELLRRRDDLEQQIAALRDHKPELDEDDYYRQLEPLMVELARLYREFPEPSPEPTP